MMMFELPHTPDFVKVAALENARRHAECLETFLRSIGVNEDNAAEYEVRETYDDELRQEVWHNETKVAEISTRLDTSDGYRFVIEFRVLEVA